MGAKIPGVTAGDLIRRELEKGASELGLAKRLAGVSDDSNAEVKRWRYVVRRAGQGAEPQEASVDHIEKVFKIPPGQLERRSRRERQRSRQEELEALVLRLEEDIARLTRRVGALERRVPRESQVEETAAR